MKCDFAPTPLLTALHEDLDDSDAPSVRDGLSCNRLPCDAVNRALKSVRIDLDALKYSSASVTSFLAIIKTNCINDATDGSGSQSSLYYITKLATVDKYLQFLFEYWLRQSTGDDKILQKQSDSAISTSISQVIQGLAGLVCSILETQPKDTAVDDKVHDVYLSSSADAFDAYQIAYYVVGCLVRLHHYTRYRPSLLSPLWKAICSIVDNLPTLSEELSSSAILALLEYLKEGLIETILRPCSKLIDDQWNQQSAAASAVTIDKAKLQYGQKILLFLLGRLATTLPRGPSCSASSDAVAAMVFIMGVPQTIASLMTQQSPETMAFAKSYQKLSDKAEKTLTVLLKEESGDAELASHLFSRIRLELLLQTTPPSWSQQTLTHGELVVSAFAVGKLNLLVQLLRSCMCHESPTDADVNSVMRVTQEAIFTVLPQHYELAIVAFDSVSLPSLISTAIMTVSQTLLYCENKAACLAPGAEPGGVRFHHFLVSLLLPVSNGPLHPMSQELAILILELHLQCLIKTNNFACIHLLSLMIKLLFSNRICIPLRTNIASVLVRVLEGPSLMLKEKIVKLICPEVVQLEAILRPPVSSRKRRACDAMTRPEDLSLLCKVISTCSGHFSFDGDPPLPDNVSGKANASYACLHAAVTTASVRAGQDMKSADATLVKSFVNAWSSDTRSPRSGHLITLAEVLLVYIRCQSQIVSDEEISRQITLLAQLCGDLTVINNIQYIGMIVEAIYALEAIAKHMHPQTPSTTLEKVARMFNILLSSKIDPVRSETMSTLISVTLTITTPQKRQIVSTAVPDAMRQLLKCRMQDELPGAPDARDLKAQHMECAKRIYEISRRQIFADKVLSSVKSFTIQIGSYVLAMPAGDGRSDGRSALAIFSPGVESLEDLRFIHEGEHFATQTVQRLQLQEDGSLKVYVTE